ncbi:LysM peptidoglycan-binding domain-containing protein [Microbacterium gorillae]|uniref:LysM peptidoglycan-binding domain-containing protein n=1 Tax=Microbacterium gorillae TaxID=1231063 RepID=UPI00058F7F8B|nr:LysM peptidoglycan-binding domain-containing protein [Microbacterium gorillae]
MSTISIAVTGIAAAPRIAATPAVPTRLRMTVRGRRVLAVLASLPIVALIAFGALSGGNAMASSEHGAPADTFQTVTVLPGDSLWGIATEIAPDADPRDVVADIISLNALGTSDLRAGQTLAIPTAYTTAD